MYQVFYIVISNHLPHFTETFESGLLSSFFIMKGNVPELLTVPSAGFYSRTSVEYVRILSSDLN